MQMKALLDLQSSPYICFEEELVSGLMDGSADNIYQLQPIQINVININQYKTNIININQYKINKINISQYKTNAAP